METIIHELTHVMASLNKSDPRSAYNLIKRYCSLKNRSERDAFQLFHLLLFHATGNLVREVLSPDYVPYAQAKNLYARTGSLFRTNLSVEKFNDIWLAWIHHKYNLEMAMQNLVDAATDN